jgi:glycosyltransferase involved in cell wall biosynthesis
MRIGFLTHHNPTNRNSFSGTAYFMREALEAAPGVEVDVVARAAHERRDQGVRSLVDGLLRRMTGRKSLKSARRDAAMARAVNRDLRTRPPDVIFSLASSFLIDRLDPMIRTPVVHVTDATPGYIREAYGKQLEAEAIERERRVIARAALVLYSSDFMARRAEAEFGDMVRGKVAVAPFGLNMEEVGPPELRPAPIEAGIRLVFIGKDWRRKGGDFALDCLRWLRAQGAPASLTLIGSTPPEPPGEGVEAIPFLDKNRPEHYARFVERLRGAHFLLLPTRGDCTPMVVAEANAFGVPALVSDIGGLRTLVEPGKNGWLLRPDDGGETYGRRILELAADPERYLRLRRSTYERYRAKLNWEAWSRAAVTAAAEAAGRGRVLVEAA